jgi:type VI secretion system protein ImpH
MATPRRQSDAPLADVLFDEPSRFDFFQIVRLVGRLFPGRRAVGRDSSPADEVVRFKTRPTLAFIPSPVQRLARPSEANQPAEMTAAALTLTGPTGALPHCYTDLMIERTRDGDPTLTAFLDVFHHRLLSLFYRAWEKHRPALALERAWDEQQTSPNGSPRAHDSISAHLFALVGLGTETLRGRHAFPDDAILYYVGLFAQRHRSVVALECLLCEFFGLPMQVIQFVEHKLRLAPADRSYLGGPGGNNALGVDFIMGDKVTDVAGKFRLRIGPLALGQFRALSPDGPQFRRLVQMTRLFVDAPLAFDVQLVLRGQDVPKCELAPGPRDGLRLGRDTWLKSRETAKNAEDAVFQTGP